ADEDEGRAVEGRGDVGRAAIQIFGQHPRGKRDEGDNQEEKSVCEKKVVVGSMGMFEEAVVVDPHDEDRAETEQEGDSGWPEGEQVMDELPAGVGIAVRDDRDVEFEDEQGHGDAEDASLKASTRAVSLSIIRGIVASGLL